MNEVSGEIIPPLELRDFNYALAQLNVDNNTFAKDDVVRPAIFNVSGSLNRSNREESFILIKLFACFKIGRIYKFCFTAAQVSTCKTIIC